MMMRGTGDGDVMTDVTPYPHVRGLVARDPHHRAQVAGDRGSAIVLAACLAMVLVLAATVASVIAALLAGQARAQSAADLAALAAADRALWGTDEACAMAATIAERNGASLTECTIDLLDVVLRVEVPPPRVAARLLLMVGVTPDPLHAQARAGPPTA
jgi:secretion/DNA translocation related TadE-like protein